MLEGHDVNGLASLINDMSFCMPATGSARYIGWFHTHSKYSLGMKCWNKIL